MIDHTFLSSTVLFHGIDSSEMELCLKTLNAYEKKYKKGEFILHAGNSTNEMGIVYEGSLSIESNDIWGNCTVLNVIRKGGFFAESYAINAGEILVPAEEVVVFDVYRAWDRCRLTVLHLERGLLVTDD